MLKQMQIKRFTVFQEADLEFSPQLNVIVGENGTGKSHLLKLAYSLIAVSAAAGKKSPDSKPSKTFLQKAYGEKLSNVFRPENLGNLVALKQRHDRCEISLFFDNHELNTNIQFSKNSKTDVDIDNLPENWDENKSIFLPARELMTIYPNFISVYENHYLEYEETWRDTCIHLGALLSRNKKEEDAFFQILFNQGLSKNVIDNLKLKMKQENYSSYTLPFTEQKNKGIKTTSIMQMLEKELGGKIVLDKNGKFYLTISGKVNMEVPLIAEGHRKLAMLLRLIANGTIQENSYLFLDEPEANLNPKLIKLIAKVVHELAIQGVQIFIATHSLFLLRELEILSGTSDNIRYFGLQSTENGVTVLQGNSIYDIGDIAALEESLQQSDRYLAMDN